MTKGSGPNKGRGEGSRDQGKGLGGETNVGSQQAWAGSLLEGRRGGGEGSVQIWRARAFQPVQ